MAATDEYEIHPAIGIARLGNSRTGYFLGPEPALGEEAYRVGKSLPDISTTPPPATFRDAHGRLLRQGVRFRVFHVKRGPDGKVVAKHEVTGDDVTIEWKVHLANRKGAAMRFFHRKKKPADKYRRNAGKKASDLIIDARAQTITKDCSPGHVLRGTFLKQDVKLGNAWVRGKHLYVLGGHGKAESVPSGEPLADERHFADSDGWYDDTSDGPVYASVIAKGQPAVAAKPAWVIVAPFDFAPEVRSFITFYEVARQAAIDNKLATESPTGFLRDIAPILRRVRQYRWVNGPTVRAETQDRHRSWASAKGLKDLGNPDSIDAKPLRPMLFAHLAPPPGEARDKLRQVFMPRLYNDDVHPRPNPIGYESDVLPLLSYQYEHMRNWANGDFEREGAQRSEYPCDALDRIALEACCGGAFQPGIEVPRIVGNRRIYDPKQPFRLHIREDGSPNAPQSPDDPRFKGLVPGQITEGLCVPWQNDFYLCQQGRENAWWPANRPDDVFHRDHPPAIIIDSQSDWTVRWDDGVADGLDMVTRWSTLGVVRRLEAFPTSDATNKEMEERVYDVQVDAFGIKRYYYCGETERTLPDSDQRTAHFPPDTAP